MVLSMQSQLEHAGPYFSPARALPSTVSVPGIFWAAAHTATTWSLVKGQALRLVARMSRLRRDWASLSDLGPLPVSPDQVSKV